MNDFDGDVNALKNVKNDDCDDCDDCDEIARPLYYSCENEIVYLFSLHLY